MAEKRMYLSANVHMDETTPHMHLLLCLLCGTKKKPKEKVSAKKC
ncbi:plasmid recombination protein [Bacillus paranthracis]